jgi:hypothetical protein
MPSVSASVTMARMIAALRLVVEAAPRTKLWSI